MKEQVLKQYKECRATYTDPDFGLDYDGMSDNINDFIELFTRGELSTFFVDVLNNKKDI